MREENPTAEVFTSLPAYEAEAAVAFSDLRDFTEIAAQHDPRKVYQTLNQVLVTQTRIVREYSGALDKFLGDGMFVYFTGDRAVERAVRCAAAWQEAISKLELPIPCAIGCGIHFGHVLFCRIGDEHRYEFTLIGDVVNVAARLCGHAHPGQILLTREAVARLPAELRARCRLIGRRKLKGKAKRIALYAFV